MQQVEINESDIPSKERIWDKMYQCRNFEISHFWQKAVFLFGFMSLCFTAYGALVLKVVEIEDYKTSSLSFLYQYMLGVSILGIIISVLWVYMMKGSKAWFEVYEKSIYAIENEIFRWENKKYVMGQWAKRMRSDFGLGFWDTKGGAFSPSKINIVIGWIILIVWIACGAFSGYNWYTIDNPSVVKCIIVVVVLLLILVCPCYIRTFIKSTPLLPKWLHNKWLLRREWNYKPFLPTIRETIDEWIDEQLAKNKLERDDDFSEEMKSDLKDLIQKEIVRQGIDCLLEGYDKDRTIYLNKIIVEGLKSILNSQKESSKSDSSDMQSKSQSKNNVK